MTKIERALTLGATLVACAAALIVVPEVRCAAGLKTEVDCTQGLGSTPLLPNTAANTSLAFAPVEDPRIRPIRELYNEIEARQPGFMAADVRLDWENADSALATVYRSGGGGIPKIRVRIDQGNERISLLFYYAGSGLVFVHEVHMRNGVKTGQEQKFYFDGGRLFEWRGPGNRLVLSSDREFRSNGAYLTRLGNHLMETMRALPGTGT